MLRVGTILRGIYRIDSYLSSGGFGNTYVATNIEFDERVAIKEFFMKGVTQRDDNQTTISVSNSENTNSFLEQKEKFKKEARRIRQLKNEHIVAVHDLFEENGTAYYVMDYVDGENLAERLKRTGKPMTEQEVRDILPQILDALKSVHDAGIWHLDLKPANIMVDKAGNVKLIDFGASKQLNTQKGGATTSTAISYTNGYAPREQMEQNYDKFGPWTDIYALGATLYNLLTNKRPPLPTDIDDDISEDKHEALPFPERVGGLRFLVLQMMKTNRMQRPQSIDAIINAENTRKEEPKQTPKQKTTTQTSSVCDDEVTIIAEPQVKKEEKKAEPKPESKHSHQVTVQPSYTSKSTKGNLSWGVIVLIFIVLITMVAFFANYKPNVNNWFQDSTLSTTQQNVELMEWDTPIGHCQYSGPVDSEKRPHGYGEAFYDYGSYKGDFKNGAMTGRGVFKYPDEGDYLTAHRHGQGTAYFPNGELEFKGTFENGYKKDGYGKETGKNNQGQAWEYVGEYKNGESDGKGTIIWDNGEKYEGDWKDGHRTGNGVLTFNEKRKGYGYKYVGGFLNNELHGKGTWYYVGGGSEKCTYKNGKQI